MSPFNVITYIVIIQYYDRFSNYLLCYLSILTGQFCICLFICWGRGHITTVPGFISGCLTNVPPHRNTMPQTQDMTPHSITLYRHRADLSL